MDVDAVQFGHTFGQDGLDALADVGKVSVDGVAVDAWYDYRVGTNEVRARDAAAAGAKANGTPWELHDVSPLEREFCLEAAVTAAQIFMRLSAVRHHLLSPACLCRYVSA